MSSAPATRDATPDDEAAWRSLWAGYTAFFAAPVPDDVTAHTWRRILDPASPVFARLAVAERRVIGFAVCVLHEGTWVRAPICYLEDLFVAADARGLGTGQALIEDLIALAGRHGWSRLYWHTEAANPARRLYDRFVPADSFVRYRMMLTDAASAR